MKPGVYFIHIKFKKTKGKVEIKKSSIGRKGRGAIYPDTRFGGDQVTVGISHNDFNSWKS